MSWQENENLTRSVLELGDPSALYRVRPARFFAKLGVGVSLILYGVAANYYWWVHGPKTLGHFELFLLLIVPLMGPTLLWHMYRNRGLYVLVYPTGLLRLLRGEVDSFPWGEVETVRLLIQNVAEARLERDSRGARRGVLAAGGRADVPHLERRPHARPRRRHRGLARAGAVRVRRPGRRGPAAHLRGPLADRLGALPGLPAAPVRGLGSDARRAVARKEVPAVAGGGRTRRVPRQAEHQADRQVAAVGGQGRDRHSEPAPVVRPRGGSRTGARGGGAFACPSGADEDGDAGDR